LSNLNDDSNFSNSCFLPQIIPSQSVTKMIRSSCFWRGIFRRAGEKRLLLSSRQSRPSVRAKFVSSVRPPACIDPTATERISVKFDIRDFCKNVPKKIRISLKSDKIDRGVFRIVGGVICGATINRTLCCVFMLKMVPQTRCFF
jgi:hypothetical protein